MSRPRKSEAARQQLLAVGIRQISTHGVNGTGLNTLLREAGIAKGSFYNFYPSKEAFLIAVVDAYSAALFAMLDQAFENPAGGAPLERLATAHRRLIALAERADHTAGCLLGAVGGEVCTTQPNMRPVLQQAFDAWRERIAVLLTEGQGDGSVRADLPASQLAETFLAMWQGALIQMRVSASSRPLVDALNVGLRLLQPAADAAPRSC